VSVILVLHRLRQDDSELKVSLGYIGSPCPKNKAKQGKWTVFKTYSSHNVPFVATYLTLLFPLHRLLLSLFKSYVDFQTKPHLPCEVYDDPQGSFFNLLLSFLLLRHCNHEHPVSSLCCHIWKPPHLQTLQL
jgi:hypothetical protein